MFFQFSTPCDDNSTTREIQLHNIFVSGETRHKPQSVTVLSHWGYNQTTLSWPLQVHKKGNLDLGNVIFPIKYAECSPMLHRTPTSLLGFGAWGSPHCLSWSSLLRAVANWATALNFAAFKRVSNFSRFKPMIKRKELIGSLGSYVIRPKVLNI